MNGWQDVRQLGLESNRRFHITHHLEGRFVLKDLERESSSEQMPMTMSRVVRYPRLLLAFASNQHVYIHNGLEVHLIGQRKETVDVSSTNWFHVLDFVVES